MKQLTYTDYQTAYNCLSSEELLACYEIVSNCLDTAKNSASDNLDARLSLADKKTVIRKILTGRKERPFFSLYY